MLAQCMGYACRVIRDWLALAERAVKSLERMAAAAEARNQFLRSEEADAVALAAWHAAEAGAQVEVTCGG